MGMKVKKNILTILLCFLMCLSSAFTIVADDTSNNQNSVDTTPETSEATDDTGLQSEDKDEESDNEDVIARGGS